jgi:broad specificity phosphatase PhoE
VKTAILVRHAESVLSLRGDVNGDPEVACPLTAAGREQARALGRRLERQPIDLCVTSVMERSGETADIALQGRNVPRLVLSDLNDIRFGRFEGGPLSEYRAWARGQDPSVPAPGGGESRADTVRRYVRAFHAILDRPEETILVIAHSLPIRYVLNAAAQQDPVPLIEQVGYTEPHRLERDELNAAVVRLERWARQPVWA